MFLFPPTVPSSTLWAQAGSSEERILRVLEEALIVSFGQSQMKCPLTAHSRHPLHQWMVNGSHTHIHTRSGEGVTRETSQNSHRVTQSVFKDQQALLHRSTRELSACFCLRLNSSSSSSSSSSPRPPFKTSESPTRP